MTALTRYAMLLDENALRQVESLQQAYELRTKADVYDLAVRVLAWLAEQTRNGYEVGRFKDETFQALLMPRDPAPKYASSQSGRRSDA